MVEKILERMEVERGFIQIPSKSKQELIGNTSLPARTLLNGFPARLDKYGRLWSSFLKNKFTVSARVEISKTENGFLVELAKSQSIEAIEPQEEKRVITLDEKALTIEDKLYFKIDSIRIYNDDFLRTNAIKASSVDLVVTSTIQHRCSI